MRRDPDVATAALRSNCASVTRGPCAVPAAAPASPATRSTPTTVANASPKARLRRLRAWDRRVAAGALPTSVLIRVPRLVDELDRVGHDRQSAVGARAHRALDPDPLPRRGRLLVGRRRVDGDARRLAS